MNEYWEHIVKGSLIATVVVVSWLGETADDYDSWQRMRTYLRMFSALTAHIINYRQEMQDVKFEHHRTYLGQRLGHFRNYMIMCMAKNILDDMVDGWAFDEDVHITLDDLKNTFIKSLCHFIVIVAFQDLLLNRYVLIVINNFKCICRAYTSHMWFYRTVSSHQVFSDSLLLNLLGHGIFNGSTLSVTNLLIRTLFKGVLPLAKWITKLIKLSIPLLIQYCVNPFDLEVTDRDIVWYARKLHGMKMITVLVYLILENYGFILDRYIDQLFHKKLEVPKAIAASPAQLFQKAIEIKKELEKKKRRKQSRLTKNKTKKKIVKKILPYNAWPVMTPIEV
jgi:hypothetical protein